MYEVVKMYSEAQDRYNAGRFTPEQCTRFDIIAALVLTADIQDLKDLLSALLADSEEHAVSN